TGARAMGMTGGNLVGRMARGAGTFGAIGAGEAALGDRDPQTGALIGAAGGAAGPVLSGLVRPNLYGRGGLERAGQVAALEGEGVPLTAGMKTGFKPLQIAEQSLGELTGQNSQEAAQRGLTRAAMTRAGDIWGGAETLTPEALNTAHETLGARYNQLASKTSMFGDAQLGTDLATVGGEYGLTAGTPAKSVEHYIDRTINLLARHGGDKMPGSAYQGLTSDITNTARAVRYNDPQQYHALLGIKSALDDAMERTLFKNGSPSLALWRQTNRQYANLMTLEHAAGRAGEEARYGLLTAPALRQALTAQLGRRGFASGAGDLN